MVSTHLFEAFLEPAMTLHPLREMLLQNIVSVQDFLDDGVSGLLEGCIPDEHTWNVYFAHHVLQIRNPSGDGVSLEFTVVDA